MFFPRRGVPFYTPKMGPKWGPNRVLDADPLGKGSWSALGALWSRKKLAWRPLGAVLERLRSLQDGLGEIGGR